MITHTMGNKCLFQLPCTSHIGLKNHTRVVPYTNIPSGGNNYSVDVVMIASYTHHIHTPMCRSL